MKLERIPHDLSIDVSDSAIDMELNRDNAGISDSVRQEHTHAKRRGLIERAQHYLQLDLLRRVNKGGDLSGPIGIIKPSCLPADLGGTGVSSRLRAH